MMAEFAGLEDNWGLQAIVRGGSFTSAFCSSDSAISTAQNSCYGLKEMTKDDRDLLFSFPDLFETAAVLSTDELGGLYNPFYPVSDSSPSAEIIQLSSIFVPNEVEEKPKEDEQKPTCCPSQSAISSSATAYAPKYKRRKNQNKRVVLQVTAEDLSCDMWAWRKYGQKPIKGSPYPRSYYRCSSSKGCLARKQVEQSCTDPSIFIVTYTEEHSHSQPTRKNALAGTVRHKFPNPKSPSKNTSKSTKAKKDSDGSSPASSSAVPSPRTPLMASIDINEYNLRSVKQEMGIEEEIGEQMIDGRRSDDNAIFSGIKLDDDFFSGLEDLDELISELSNGHFSNKQFPVG